METMTSVNKISEWIEDNKEPFLKVSKEIWESPELSMQEHIAMNLVSVLLSENGFILEKGIAGMPTAFLAKWGTGKPVIGFTVEYDALPGLSQKCDSEVCEPIIDGAPGHGCGHNLMAIGGALAAVALKEHLLAENITATIKVFGTPGEEVEIGKPFMARAGYFDDVDVFLDWHGDSKNKANATYNTGYFNLKYHYQGQTCHGNSPWFGKSTLDAAILTSHAIELLREHLPPVSNDCITTINYAFPDVGNSFPNVIPDKTTLWVVGRSGNVTLLNEIIERLHKCAEGCASATGTAVTHEIISAVPNMLPNTVIAKVMNKNLRLIGVPTFTEEEQQMGKRVQKSLGVQQTGFNDQIEDFCTCEMPASDAGQLTWYAPYAILLLALLPTNMGWHNWLVTKFAGNSVGEKVVLTAAKVIAATALELINNPLIIEEAKAEMKKRIADTPNWLILPQDIEPQIQMHSEEMKKFHHQY